MHLNTLKPAAGAKKTAKQKNQWVKFDFDGALIRVRLKVRGRTSKINKFWTPALAVFFGVHVILDDFL